MIFSYTARDMKGALDKGTLEAADRAAAIRALAGRGLIPVSVTEGGTLAGSPFGGHGVNPRLLATAGCVLLAVAIGAFFFLRPSLSRKTPRTNTKPPAAATNDNKKPPTSSRQGAAAPSGEAPTAAIAPKTVTPSKTAAQTAATTNTPLPIRGAQRQLAEAIAKGERVTPYFKHESESILAIYTQPGTDVIPHPIPDNFEQDMRAALQEDIVIEPDDSPEIERQKELVAWIKEDMKKFIADGGTALEYLDKLKKSEEDDSKLYREANSLMAELIDKGDKKEVLDAYNQLNAELKEKGIVPLRLPRRVRQALGIQ